MFVPAPRRARMAPSAAEQENQCPARKTRPPHAQATSPQRDAAQGTGVFASARPRGRLPRPGRRRSHRAPRAGAAVPHRELRGHEQGGPCPSSTACTSSSARATPTSWPPAPTRRSARASSSPSPEATPQLAPVPLRGAPRTCGARGARHRGRLDPRRLLGPRGRHLHLGPRRHGHQGDADRRARGGRVRALPWRAAAARPHPGVWRGRGVPAAGARARWRRRWRSAACGWSSWWTRATTP